LQEFVQNVFLAACRPFELSGEFWSLAKYHGFPELLFQKPLDLLKEVTKKKERKGMSSGFISVFHPG
jgi:hypothetical protein